MVEIGPNGTYALRNGTLNVNGGFENLGVLDLSNNSAVFNASSSLIKFAGTVLAAPGTGALNIDDHSLLMVPALFDPATYFASYSNAGILHHAGDILTIFSAYSISGIGIIDDHVNCYGSLTAKPGYAIQLNKGLYVADTGCVDLGTGTLFVENLISGMNGGNINASSLSVGSSATGKFQQSGGLNTITTSITLGSNVGVVSALLSLTAPDKLSRPSSSLAIQVPARRGSDRRSQLPIQYALPRLQNHGNRNVYAQWHGESFRPR